MTGSIAVGLIACGVVLIVSVLFKMAAYECAAHRRMDRTLTMLRWAGVMNLAAFWLCLMTVSEAAGGLKPRVVGTQSAAHAGASWNSYPPQTVSR